MIMKNNWQSLNVQTEVSITLCGCAKETQIYKKVLKNSKLLTNKYFQRQKIHLFSIFLCYTFSFKVDANRKL